MLIPKHLYPYRYFFLGFTLLVLYRIFSGFFAPLPLQVDEAQYVGWSHQLEAGYYSKPPFIAWVLGLNQWACRSLGIESLEGCSRGLQALALAVASASAGFSSWALFRNLKAAVYTTALLITSPLFGFYSLFATTDAWLLMWWSLALWLFILASYGENQEIIFWVLCGVAVGFGLLSKYSMGIFILSAFLWIVFTKKIFRKGPWIAVITAGLIFLPNIVWNYENDFPTISHHIEISQIQNFSANSWDLVRSISSFVQFFLAQFLLLGPLVLIGFLGACFKFRGEKPCIRKPQLILVFFVAPIFLIVLAQAFLTRAHANWAAPAYIGVAILVISIWFEKTAGGGRRSQRAYYSLSVGFGLVCSMVFIHGLKFAYWSPHAPSLRAVESLRGWREAALNLIELAEKNDLPIVAEDRRILAALNAYRSSKLIEIYAFDSSGRRNNHYSRFTNIDDRSALMNQLVIWARVEPSPLQGEIRGDIGTAANSPPGPRLASIPVAGGGEQIAVRIDLWESIRK